jgi:hypothetical protein
MYCPYISAAAQAQTQANTAQQAEWLENAIVNGPLPTHKLHKHTLIADIQDDNPTVEVLYAVQETLAITN